MQIVANLSAPSSGPTGHRRCRLLIRLRHDRPPGFPSTFFNRVVVASTIGSYSAGMDKLDALLGRLKAGQRDLIMRAAEHNTMPAGSTLKRIAELENATAAVEAVAAEEASKGRN